MNSNIFSRNNLYERSSSCASIACDNADGADAGAGMAGGCDPSVDGRPERQPASSVPITAGSITTATSGTSGGGSRHHRRQHSRHHKPSGDDADGATTTAGDNATEGGTPVRAALLSLRDDGNVFKAARAAVGPAADAVAARASSAAGSADTDTDRDSSRGPSAVSRLKQVYQKDGIISRNSSTNYDDDAPPPPASLWAHGSTPGEPTSGGRDNNDNGAGVGALSPSSPRRKRATTSSPKTDGDNNNKSSRSSRGGGRPAPSPPRPSPNSGGSPRRGRKQQPSSSSSPRAATPTRMSSSPRTSSNSKRNRRKLKVSVALDEGPSNNTALGGRNHPAARAHTTHQQCADGGGAKTTSTGGGGGGGRGRRRSLSPSIKIPEVFTRGNLVTTSSLSSSSSSVSAAVRQRPKVTPASAGGATGGPSPVNAAINVGGVGGDPSSRNRSQSPTKTTGAEAGSRGDSGSQRYETRRRSLSPRLKIPEAFTKGNIVATSSLSSSIRAAAARQRPMVTPTSARDATGPRPVAPINVGLDGTPPSRNRSQSPTTTTTTTGAGADQRWRRQIDSDRVPGTLIVRKDCRSDIVSDLDTIVGLNDTDSTDGGWGERSVSSRIQMFGGGEGGASVEGSTPNTPNGRGGDELRSPDLLFTTSRRGTPSMGSTTSGIGGDGSNSKLRDRTISGVPLTVGTHGGSSPGLSDADSRRGGALRRGKRPGGLYNWIKRDNGNPHDGIDDDENDERYEFSNDKSLNRFVDNKSRKQRPFLAEGENSGQSLTLRTVDRLTDDDFDDENDTIDEGDYDDYLRRGLGASTSYSLSSDDGMVSEDGITGRGGVDTIQRRLTQARDRAQQWQSRYKQERSEWQAAQVELERVKKERDRLLQDQAEQRKMLSDSQEDAKVHEEELAKIQKTLEWTNTCKASGSTTEGAKNALGLQSRIEALVQENRQLQSERENFLQQQVVSKEQNKRRNFFSSDSDAEMSLPKTLMKFLHSIVQLQREVVRQIGLTSVTGGHGNDNVVVTALPSPSLQKTSQWIECEASFKEILQASQHYIAIENGVYEIHRHYQEQLQAVSKQEETFQYHLQGLKTTHRAEIANLEAQLEELNSINVQDGEMVAQQSEALRHTLEHDRVMEKKYEQLISEHDEQTLFLRKQIEEWKKTNAEDGAAAAKHIQQLADCIQDRDSQIAMLQHQKVEIESLRVEDEQKLASMRQTVETITQDNEKLTTEKSDQDLGPIFQFELQSMRLSLSTQESELQQLREALKSQTLEAEKLLKQEREAFDTHKLSMRDEVNFEVQRNFSLSNELSCASEQIEAYMKELQSAERHRDESLQHADQMQIQVHDLQSGMAQAAKKIATLQEAHRASLACLVAEHQEQLEDLHKELGRMKSLEVELETNHRHFRKLSKEMQGSTSSWNVTVGTGEDQVTNRTIEIEGMVAAWIESYRTAWLDKQHAEDEKEEYRKEIKRLRQELDEAAGEYAQNLAAIEGEKTRIMEESERQKQEIEAMEKEMMNNPGQKSNSLSSVQNLEMSNASLNELDWSEVNDFVETLKEQNETHFSEKKRTGDLEQNLLLQCNSAQKNTIVLLEQKFREVKFSAEARDAKFHEAIRRQQLSMDSLYEDLILAREQIAQLGVLLSELEGGDPKNDRTSQLINKFHLIDSFDNAQIKKDRRRALMDATQSLIAQTRSKHPRRANLQGDSGTATISMIEGVARTDQSDSLKMLMEKKQTVSRWRFFGSANKAGDNSRSESAYVKALEEENQALKSSLVKIQSQHKEALYKHKNAVRELELANEAILLRNMVLAEQQVHENPMS